MAAKEQDQQDADILSYDVEKTTESLEDWLKRNKPSQILKTKAIKWIRVQSPYKTETTVDVAALQNEWKEITEPRTIELIQELAEKYKDKAGKWITTFRMVKLDNEIDNIWKLIATSMMEGKLGRICHFARVGLHRADKMAFFLTVHNCNFLEKGKTFEVEKELRMFGIRDDMRYKPDIFTHCEIYTNNPWFIFPTIYKSCWSEISNDSLITETMKQNSTKEIKKPAFRLSHMEYDDFIRYRDYSSSLQGVSYDPRNPIMPFEEWLMDYRPSNKTGIISNRTIGNITVLSRIHLWNFPDTKKIQKAWETHVNSKESVSPEVFQKIAIDFKATSGSWYIMIKNEDIVDHLWQLIAKNIVDGRLGEICLSAYVFTAINIRCIDEHFIIGIQNPDYLNINEVYEVEQELRKLGIKENMFYKPYIYTQCRIYPGNPWHICPMIKKSVYNYGKRESEIQEFPFFEKKKDGNQEFY